MKILLLQLKRIGDLVLTTPAIRCLREAFPDARLALVADSACASLLSCIDVDERWIYHKRGGARGLAGWGQNAWLRHGLLAFRPHWTLDFTGSDRSAYLSALSRSPRRVTFQRFQKKPLRRLIYTDFIKSSVVERHTADHYTDLLAAMGVERDNVPSNLRLHEKTLATTRTRVANAGVTGPYAVVHAGTARPEKYWMADRWAKVIQFLKGKHGLATVLTGSQDRREREHLSEIKSYLGSECIDLSGATDLPGLAAAIEGAKLFCGVDTAAMHLADAVKTPSVALFGPTNPYHWRPRHTPSVVLRAQTPPPFTPRQEGGSMREITVESVIEAVQKLLNEGRVTGDA